MSKTIKYSRIVLLFILFIGQNIVADELIMRDGSRLIGKVVRKETHILVFDTSFAGRINVKWDQISELRTDEPATVLLSNEDVIKVRVFKNTGENTVVEQEPGEPLRTLTPSELAFINPAPWRLGQGFRFTGRVDIALEYDRGNTETDEIDLDGNLLWRRRYDRFSFYGELENDRNRGENTKEEWLTRSKYDYFFKDQWYYGAFLGLEHDKFADIDLRAVIGPHIGRQFFEGDVMNLEAELGIMRVREELDINPDENYWATRWSIEFDRYFFGDFVQFYHRQGGLWNLSNADDVVLQTWTGFRFPLKIGFVASTELQADYDGGAPDDVDEVDTTLRFKFGYQW